MQPSTLKLMTSLNSKHLDMRSSNFIHNLLTHLDVLLCSKREAFFFCVLRFLVFKSVLFQASASQRSGESLPLTGVRFARLCWDSDLPHTRNELWIPHRLQLATAFSNFAALRQNMFLHFTALRSSHQHLVVWTSVTSVEHQAFPEQTCDGCYLYHLSLLL